METGQAINDEKKSLLEKIKKGTIKIKSNHKLLNVMGMLTIGVIGGVLGSYLFTLYPSLQTINKLNFSNINIQETSQVTTTAKKVMPAVVSITGVSKTINFFGQSTNSESAGTGYIVSPDGLIVTNKHVVGATSAIYTVITNEGKSYPAEVKAVDPVFDIAILSISAKDLPTVEIGTSDSLIPGQTAIAIGNALGQYQNSVTVGVVSGIGRVIEASDSTGTSTESLDNVIQTDAAINSGNSGGPLLNIAGQVIGMNTAVNSQGQGIGFALPINLVKSALKSYTARGKIVRPMLGVRYVSLTKDISTKNDLPVSDGAYIYSGNSSQPSVVAGSPADKLGLKTGDIITAINNDKITVQTSLVSLLARYAPGDSVKITYLRDKKSVTATVTLTDNQ